MTTKRDRGTASADLAAAIRDAATSDATRQMLSRMPIFRPSYDMPAHFEDLLGTLDRVSRHGADRRAS